MRKIITFSVLMLMIIACSFGVLADEWRVLRIPEHEPSGFDPTYSGHGYYLTENMYCTLVNVIVNPGEIMPWAAESWEWCADGITLTFHLREGMEWTDGTPLTAYDYEYGWLRHLHPQTASYDPSDLFVVKNALAYNAGEVSVDEVGIKALDDLTLQVILEEPVGWFLAALGRNRWMPQPQWAIEEHGPEWVEARNVVSTGPYKMVKWDHDREVVLQVNDNWWGLNDDWWGYPRFVPQIDEIQFIIVEDAWGQGLMLYEAGEVDNAVVPPGDLDRIQNHPVFSEQLDRFGIIGVVLLNLDTANPPLDDVRVRQAISLAIDREALTQQVLRGAFAPAYSLVPPGIGPRNPDSAIEGDIAKAQALLAEAGFPNGAGMRELTLTFWAVDRARRSAEAIQAMLQMSLGIRIRLEPIEPAAMGSWRSNRATQPYDMYWALAWSGKGIAYDYHNSIWDSQAIRYWTRYSNPEYDQMIRAASREPDEEIRHQLYFEAEAMINYDLPSIPLMYEAQMQLTNPRVKGLQEATSPLSLIRLYFDGVYIDD